MPRNTPIIPYRKPRRLFWASALTVVIVVGLFWVAYGLDRDRLFGPSPYHRLQVEALAEGRFSLGSSLEHIEHGLAWHNGQINQVWGLGAPLWILPYEWVYRLFGGRVFPDRICLLAAMALVAWYASRGGMALAKALRSKIAGICFVYLVVLFPPVWNLILGRQVIYEETILYACLVSVGLLVAVTRFLLLRRRSDFWIVCILGGLSGLVRVTHGVYGLMAGLVCGVVMLRAAVCAPGAEKKYDKSRLVELLLGWTVLLAGFLLLGYSNAIRFGSPGECGHRLTNISEEVIYLTRFGNPFEHAGVCAAGRELVSWIFLSPFHYRGPDDSHDLVPWQASTARWRGIDQPTFDPSYLLILVFGCLVGSIFLYRRARKQGWNLFPPGRPVQCAFEGILIWFIGSGVAVAGFYLYVPILTTRYILDFAPSLLAPFVLVLLLCARRWPRSVAVLSLVWLCCQSWAIWSHQGGGRVGAGLARDELTRLPKPTGRKLASFNGRYSIEDLPAETNIRYNGQGWDSRNASAIVTLALDHPQFVEISVGRCERQDGISDVYRAKIGNLELPLESTLPAAEGSNGAIKVRFAIPERIRRQNGDQLLFLCFVGGWQKVDQLSRRPLYEVRWK